MVPGYNTDFKYRGRTFHVQTEDNGTANPVVVSLLYHKGAILASRKTPYHDLLADAECTERLKELMKSQHKALMRELLAGAYDAKIPSGTGKTGAESATKDARPAGVPAPGEPVSRPAVTTDLRAPLPPAAAPRRPTASLDEAIMRYLEEHAAAAAAAR